MENVQTFGYRFGPFEVHTEARCLLRHGQPVRLQDQPFDLLITLLEKPGAVIEREYLYCRLWSDGTFVNFETSIKVALKKVRDALGDDAANPTYIETIPKRGYRFIAPLERINAPVTAELRNLEPAAPATLPQHATPRNRDSRRTPILWSLVALLAAALSITLLWKLDRQAQPSAPVDIHAITHTGNIDLHPDIFTDGPRVYFRTLENGQIGFSYVFAQGGENYPLTIPLTNFKVLDISPNGGELLARDNTANPQPLWIIPLPVGSPRPVGTLRAHDAGWSPDGAQLALGIGSELWLANADGGNAHRVEGFDGYVLGPRWSPDGKLVCFAAESGDWKRSLWALDVAKGAFHRLDLNLPKDSYPNPGGWSADGRYYFFSAFAGGVRNIWAVRIGAGGASDFSRDPIQITSGPLRFSYPTPARSGNRVFALGEAQHGELMRIRPGRSEAVAYAENLPADQVTFSPDGKRMAYVEYPRGQLFRAQADGSGALLLTTAPMFVTLPSWSPDGGLIAYVDRNSLHLVPSAGGTVRDIFPLLSDQVTGYCWLPEADSMLVSAKLKGQSVSKIFLGKISTGEIMLQKDSEDLTLSSCARDGKRASAHTTGDPKILYLWDRDTGHRTKLADYADFPMWMSDGQSILYNTVMNNRVPVAERGVYRLRIGDKSAEKVAPAPGFSLIGVWSYWTGMAPDGSLLMLKDTSARDIYALDVHLP